jgi:hypothetical protein
MVLSPVLAKNVNESIFPFFVSFSLDVGKQPDP